jgi:hypothetical protein
MKIQLHIVAENLHNCSLYLETQRPAEKLQCEKSGRALENKGAIVDAMGHISY